jgi:hypothetical protein
MSKVINLNNITHLDLPPDRILNEAIGNMESVVILGYDKEENEYFASSIADGADVVWLLEKCKKYLLEIEDE